VVDVGGKERCGGGGGHHICEIYKYRGRWWYVRGGDIDVRDIHKNTHIKEVGVWMRGGHWT